MKKLSEKENKIVTVVDTGLFDEDDLGSVKAMINAAGDMLDHACSHDICGSPVFKAADGKWYVGSVEFSVAPVNPQYLIDHLLGEEFYECPNCGQLDKLEDMSEGSGDGSNRCTKCDHDSVKVTKKRAAEIAAGKPRKK